MNIRCLFGHKPRLVYLTRTDSARFPQMDRYVKTYVCHRTNCDHTKSKVTYVSKMQERKNNENR